MNDRTYSLPAWRIRLSQAGLLLLFSACVLVLVPDGAPIPLWVVNSVAACVGIWFTLVRLPKRRVAETEAGLSTFHLLTGEARTVPWETIERFEIVPGSGGRAVAAMHAPKGRTPIVGLDAKAKMMVSEGESKWRTEHLVADLNERLVGWQRAKARHAS